MKWAANYIHGLRAIGLPERNSILQSTAAFLAGERGEAFEKGIEEGCEQVDRNGDTPRNEAL